MVSEPSESGSERHPADKAADEALDDLADVYGEDRISIAEDGVDMMRHRWKAFGDEAAPTQEETYWLVYLYRFEPDDEGWFLWTTVGLVEDRETWQEWWKRVQQGDIDLPPMYQGEGWWCSDRPVSFGLYEPEPDDGLRADGGPGQTGAVRYECPSCGFTGLPGGDTLVRVWEDRPATSASPPDFIGCKDCSEMHEFDESNFVEVATDGGQPGTERRRIRQEIVLRVRTTPSGVKVLEFDGTGLREGVMSKRDRRYCYGDDAEEKATEYAYRKKEELEEQRDCPVIVVELGEVMHEKLARFDDEPELVTDGGVDQPGSKRLRWSR